MTVMQTTNAVERQAIIAPHLNAAPVKVVPIARDLGLKVYRVSKWGDDLSGMIRKDSEHGGATGYAIYVNANHAEVRRRFTIAHEIGHYVLHDSLIGDGITDDALYRSNLSNAIEAQANRFAADLLMPRPLIKHAIASGINTVKALAKHFEVSETAMSIRLGLRS